MKILETTDTKYEEDEGRIALWLHPDDIAFIANEWRKIPGNVSQNDKDIWARLAFLASTALHKSGVKYEPVFPNENEIYKL